MTDETQKAIELLDKLAILAEKYTPQVYQTAVNVVQIQAMGKLCLSALFLFFQIRILGPAFRKSSHSQHCFVL